LSDIWIQSKGIQDFELDVVMHPSNPSYSRHGSRRITNSGPALAKLSRYYLKKKGLRAWPM
jgi:hypothetical protein